jgi:hypothetical protein
LELGDDLPPLGRYPDELISAQALAANDSGLQLFRLEPERAAFALSYFPRDSGHQAA